MTASFLPSQSRIAADRDGNLALRTLPRTGTADARAAIWTGILATAKHLGKQRLPPAERVPSVVTIKEGVTENPVYIIGARLAEFRIAQLMSTPRSVFAVEVPWRSAWRYAVAKNDVSAMPSMEEMVTPYVEALSVHARSMPCVLVGHSFAGLMAFEAAHQLQQRGCKVEMVLLLDAPATYPPAHQVVWQILQKVWSVTHGEVGWADPRLIASRLRDSWSICRWMIANKMNGLSRFFLQVLRRDQNGLTTNLDDRGEPVHWQFIKRLYDNATKYYRLRNLDCRGVLFRADPQDERVIRAFDSSLGWGDLFEKGLEIVQVTGDHFTMMWQQPHDHTLAREMSKALDQSFSECNRGYSAGSAVH
jgi:thioesterase domain-containing protein